MLILSTMFLVTCLFRRSQSRVVRGSPLLLGIVLLLNVPVGQV